MPNVFMEQDCKHCITYHSEKEENMANITQRGVGVFSDQQALERVLHELKAANFPLENVSVIAQQLEKGQFEDAQLSDRVGDQKVRSAVGIATDAATTATWGTILVGLTSLAIPGAGPILAAGSLGVALLTGLAGTGLGTAAFANLTKALTKLGIPEEDARVYSEHLNRENYLVIVEGTEEQIQQAESLLNRQQIQDWAVYPAA